MSVKGIMSSWCHTATEPILGWTANALLLHCSPGLLTWCESPCGVRCGV